MPLEPEDLIHLRAALARLFLGFFVIFTIAFIQGLHLGFHHHDYLFLACGAVVSFFCAVAYSCIGIARANDRRKGAWMFFAIVSGWVPYVFIIYLIFYRGLWGFVRLFPEFFWYRLLSALAFTFIGFFILRKLQAVNAVVRKIRGTIDP